MLASKEMEILQAGAALFCVLAVATSQVPPPSSADIQCIQQVVFRGDLNGCTDGTFTTVSPWKKI